MGSGGGGGRGLTPDELKSLQQKAKKSLKDADGAGKCNVLISFSSEDLGEVKSYTFRTRPPIANGLIGKSKRASPWAKVSSSCIRAVAQSLDCP